MIQVSSRFDSGNIEVVSAEDPSGVRLRIVKDGAADFFQWFHFRVSGARGVPLTLAIENAGAASYPKCWEDYRAVASTDRKTWRRVDTGYDGTTLTIRHTPSPWSSKSGMQTSESELVEKTYGERPASSCSPCTRSRRSLKL